MTTPTPQRYVVPDLARLREISGLGYTQTPDAILETIAGLPPDDPFTPTCHDWLTVRWHRRRGEYALELPILMRLIRRAPVAGAFGHMLRIDLSDALLRLGFPERAERLVRKAMGSYSFGSLDESIRAACFGELGRFYRRRGQLSLACRMFEQALTSHPDPSRVQFTLVTNLFDAMLHADRMEEARGILSGLGVYDRVESARPMLWYRDSMWIAYHLQSGDAAACGPHLERMLESIGKVEGTRNQRLYLSYVAEILLVAGRYAEAVERYEHVIDLTLRAGTDADIIGNLARGLAESLLRLGDPVRGEDRASFGIRIAARGDRVEELAGLRVQAECRWAMGRHDEARESFMRLLARHTGFEFVRERKRVESVMTALGILPAPSGPLPGAGGEPVPARSARAPESRTRGPEPVRLELRDGREFVTTDLELVRQMRRAAESDLPVLIEGETGTGKDLVATLVHELGPRAAAPFVVADCATLPEGLMESELFGAVRGAYSGSTENRPGIVARSDGGTLFLDELPELSLSAQAKLLRLLQDGSYRRVGESSTQSVRTRFVAATNRPIADALARKVLKLDLYHRLNGHRIHLRPLRERRDEIAVLAEHLVRRAGAPGIAREAVRMLERQPWPGNVRELEMVLRVVASGLEPGESVSASHLERALTLSTSEFSSGGLREQRRAAERAVLDQALRSNGRNVSAAARSLGISRQAFYKALRRSGARDEE